MRKIFTSLDIFAIIDKGNMSLGLENLEKLEYPGRVIIIGRDLKDNVLVLYALTGRSASSQARKLELEDKTIYVKPTDLALVNQGDPDLLIYPAIIIKDSGIVISNGKQTVDIEESFLTNETPQEILKKGIENWDYETEIVNDNPIYTARISGCVVHGSAALSIIRRSTGGSNIKDYFEIQPISGSGKIISTYTGVNINPLPMFEGEPKDIALNFESLEEAVNTVFDSLNPAFRIAAAGVLFDPKTGSHQIKIINKN